MGRFDDKTEKATPHKRKEARKEGTVAKSQEIGTAVTLLVAIAVLKVFVPGGLEAFAREARLLFSSASVEQLQNGSLLGTVGRMSIAVLAPFLGATVLGATVAGVAQVGFKLTPKAAQPKLSNLKPSKGFEKFKPANLLWELVRNTAKLGLLFVLVWGPLSAWSDEPPLGLSLSGGLAAVAESMWTILTRLLLLSVLIAIADYAWNRYRTNKQLKMSKHDVKQEHKSQEGDPHVKGQRRRRQQDLSRNRMIGNAASADVVVTNPTHLAVALLYTVDEGAPRVVAKGADKLAARIRQEASRNGVPLTENKPLARALYRQVAVDSYVPAALFEAVATVLAVAYRRRGRGPRTAAEVTV